MQQLIDYEKIWEEMARFYGKNFANPEHEPKRFAWQCKMFKYLTKSGLL